ncbi:hypothetical protein NGRA_1458 [Nosema granulosis]|uniref:Uncharacterized protein n=1 Tax=Nosema granulosis TaxID=83296 RepID=A0A9P6GYY6_9MICR|nr:hypothetical protein NGRA_1458 [Nosema granulosis]
MENLTLKILESPEKITSNDFISIYNTVYTHCTQKSDVFVVRGKDVYDSLKSVLVSYFENLRPISSLKSFNRLFHKFIKSLDLLTASYSYLERYYIKSAINIRDGYTQDITTLSYSIFYSKYMASYTQNLISNLLHEIEFQRKSENPKFENVAQASANLNTLLLYNDLGDVYEELVDRYYKIFYKSVKDTPISNIIQKTHREIEMAQHFFGFSHRSDFLKLTSCLSRRVKESLDFYVLEFNIQNNLFEYFSKIFYHMKEEHSRMFIETHNKLVLKEMEGMGIIDLVIYYIDTVILFMRNPLNTSSILQTVEEYLKKTLSNKENVVDLVDLVEEIRVDKNPKINNIIKNRAVDTKLALELAMKAIKLSHEHEKIIKSITRNIQHRLINENVDFSYENNFTNENVDFSYSFTRDQMLMVSIETVFGSSYISWLKISIDRFLKPTRQNFGIANQENDLKTEIHLLTRGFWSIPETKTTLHPTLRGIESILIKQSLNMFPRSEINTCYRASPAIFSLNEYDFRVSSDVLSMIMYFSECSSLEKVRELAKDANFEDNLRLCLENGIFIQKDGEIFINSNFNQLNYDGIIERNYNGRKRSKNKDDLEASKNKDDLEATKGIIDLFKVELKSPISAKDSIGKNNSLEMAIEAFVVRTLKKRKKMAVKELLENINKSYSCKGVGIEEILKKLQSKEFVKVEKESISYLV